MSDIPGFLDYLFGQRAGAACLGWIDGDPLIEEIDGDHQEWYRWPAQRDTMINQAEWHAAQGHNLYVRQTLFSQKRGTKGAALPSPILWQDDATIDTPASRLIESSKGNYQAFITLDRLTTTDERTRMMRAWRNARPGADDCSANPVAFVRVPGGHNRKRHGDWIVRYAVQSPRTYTADRLLARCRAGKGETHPTASLGGLDQTKLDYWQAHIDQLLNDERTLPRAFVRDTPGRRILELRAQGKGMLFHASGTWDASRERLWLANSLVMARYLNEQIAALLWHFEISETIEIKGETAVWADISRVIGMARAAHPNVHPRLYGARPAAKAKVSRGRAGKHAELVENVYQLLIEHRAGAQAIIKSGEIAGVIGCDRRTIVTILNELRTAKRIETKPLGQHGGLVVTFAGVIYSAAETAELPIAAPEIAPREIALGETEIPVGCVSPDRAEADHISEPPTLDELARAYWSDTANGRRVNESTGLITTRRTAKHFADLVCADYPAYTSDQARAAYKAEQHRLDRLEREIWQRFFAWLRSLSDQELITYIAGRARASLLGVVDHTEEQELKVNTFDKHLYIARLKCAKLQLARRGLKMPAKPTKEKPVTPATRRTVAPVVLVEQLPLPAAPAQSPYYPGFVNDMVARLKTSQVQP